MKFANESGHCEARLRDGIGMIGSFEAQNDPERVRALLHEAARWLRDQGATRVIGPMDGDTWHRYRVNAGPFDTPPFLLEPVNPPYYDALWRHAGFDVIERYTSKRVDDIAPLIEKLAPMYQRAVARGYAIRSIDPTRLRDELTSIWRMSLEIFRGNRFYFDIALDDFLQLYDGIERLLVPELVLFIDGVAFLFAYPDTDTRTVNYKTIGVLPTHRYGYLGWALLHRAYSDALSIGRPIANHCLMHESNASQSMDAGHGTTFRNYYLYELPQ